MFNKKTLVTKILACGLSVFTMVGTPAAAFAATSSDIDTDNGIVKTVVETDAGTVTEGMIQGSGQTEGTATGMRPMWLAYGPLYQYPAEGGTWEYGFWNVKVRSYYTVNRCHGSTVKLDDKQSRSVDTASGKTSIAELWAIQSPNANDRYYYRVCG
jgi:hypothetical protein